MALGTCDELTHPDKTYKEWAKTIVQVAGQSEDDITKHIVGVELMKGQLSVVPILFLRICDQLISITHSAI